MPSTSTAIGLAVLVTLVLLYLGGEPLVPPLLAITLALTTRQVLFSLLVGVLLGSMLHHDSFVVGAARVFDTYIVDAMTDKTHASIILFSVALAGMVGVISRSGGTRGIVKELVKYAHGPRSGQLATWAMGLFIFFDDYANTLVVGNTMRPLTDRLRISREKLSYLVDSTSAPVASLAIISTWIGYEISLISDSFQKCGIGQWTGYAAFMESIPYRFYCILTIVMVFLIGLLVRDFGPMAEAEKRTRRTGRTLGEDAHPLSSYGTDETEPPAGTPLRWYNAMLPIATLIVMTMYGLYYTGCNGLLDDARAKAKVVMRQQFIQAETVKAGRNPDDKALVAIEAQVKAATPAIEAEAAKVLDAAPLRDVIAKAESGQVLLWSAFTCSLLAILLPLIQGVGGGLEQLFDAWVAGAKSMVLATMILILAWSLGAVCEHLHTADFIVHYAKDVVSPWVLPGMTFVIASAMAFATGTSWGTMSIVLPLAIPLAHKLGVSQHLEPLVYQNVLFGTIGAVLSGACFGDHSSPISDTTIMSSMASGCDHVDHVRTQLPYALVVAGTAVLCCYVPSGLGISPLWTIPFGVAVILAVIWFVGEPTDRESRGGSESVIDREPSGSAD